MAARQPVNNTKSDKFRERFDRLAAFARHLQGKRDFLFVVFYDLAIADFYALLATLAACGVIPRNWGKPDDTPAPAQPLDLLTPLQPHAPDALTLRERLAA